MSHLLTLDFWEDSTYDVVEAEVTHLVTVDGQLIKYHTTRGEDQAQMFLAKMDLFQICVIIVACLAT